MYGGQHYRITAPTIALELRGGEAKMIHLPTGATVLIQGESSTCSQMMDVLWEHRVVMMFARDLRERARLVLDSVA